MTQPKFFRRGGSQDRRVQRGDPAARPEQGPGYLVARRPRPSQGPNPAAVRALPRQPGDLRVSGGDGVLWHHHGRRISRHQHQVPQPEVGLTPRSDYLYGLI